MVIAVDSGSSGLGSSPGRLKDSYLKLKKVK